MNIDTSRMYQTPESIAAAEGRGEPLIYGEQRIIEKVRRRLMASASTGPNRHERRKAKKVSRKRK